MEEQRVATAPIDPLLSRGPVPGHRLDDLYAQLHRRLTGLAAAITLDRGVAPDIVHDAFAGIAGRLHAVDDPIAYLQRSVVNLSVRWVQRRQRARNLPVAPLASVVNPETDELWAIVARLPARQRALVVLRFWEDLTHEQIASVLGTPVGSVKSGLHRALATLRDLVADDTSTATTIEEGR